MSDVEAVKSRINIVEVVSEFVRMKRSGTNYFGLCPFHSEKSPSFSVNETLQLFKCFGCGEQGDAITFLMKVQGLEFREALETLAEKVGYTLTQGAKSPADVKEKESIEKLAKINRFVADFYQQKLAEGDNPGMEYAKKRNLDANLIKKFGIGYASSERTVLTKLLLQKGCTKEELVKFGLSSDKNGDTIDKFRNRLIFSILDERGRYAGFSGRYIGPDNPDIKPPKYLNSPETLIFKKSNILFGLYQGQEAIRKLNFVIVSEGQMNIISSHRVGVENIVASLGTSFTEQHIKLLSRFTKNIYFAFDKDNAGKKALLRTLEMIFKSELNAKVIDWDPKLGKDPDELIISNHKYWIEAVNNPADPIEYMYAEFERKFGLNNLDMVNSFLQTILHLISMYKNDVKKEFYLKFLSNKFDLTVTALQEMMTKRTNLPRMVEKKKINDGKEISKVEVGIFDKIFALILQNWNNTRHMILGLERDYMPPKYRDLYDCLFLYTDCEDLKEVSQGLEGAERELFENLLLMSIITDDTKAAEEHIIKLVPQGKNEYKKMLVIEWRKNPNDPTILEEVRKVLGTNI